jgi:hypothetical protein
MPKPHPKRLKRAESFLGIHFDFHAGKDCTEIGKNVTREMVERIIDLVHPDFIQCDCKGHPGISSYPTKVGNPAPGFVRDALRIWREVTAERGVALYTHYSGVWDTEAVRRHPSWALVKADGKRHKDLTSVFGPYVDKLLIPQLRELADEYGVDGVWVDGECWATAPDYSKRALEGFREETGITTVPRKPEDPHYAEFMEFCREAFRRYLRHYVDEVHRTNPDFQIASNWAFSSLMPGRVAANVDYLSGDFSMQDSVNVARLEARCLANQGKPWDLMAWGFSGRWEDHARSTKSPVQLQQEAAQVLALGGGFQAYFTQKRDGSISDWQMNVMAEVAKFCRARQAFCHCAQAVPQIGLLYSTADFYRRNRNLFGAGAGILSPLSGILNALLESQHCVEIVCEHHLTGPPYGGRDYPLIVIPEWEYLQPDFIKELLAYVAGGGSLLVIGPKAVALFDEALHLTLEGKPHEQPKWLEHDGALAGVQGLFQRAALGPKTKPFGSVYAQNDFTSEAETAGAITSYGKGKIGAVFLNLGERYRRAKAPVIRDFLNALVGELFPHPLVEVTGSHFVDVVVNRIGGKLAVNLLNTAGPHHDSSIYVYDEVPPVGPLSVRVRTGEKPSKVTRQPAGEEMPFEFHKGAVHLAVPRLDIHDIIVLE